MLKKRLGALAITTLILGTIGITTADNNFGASGASYTAGYGVIGAGSMDNGTPRAISTVKNVINRVLGILGLIALILCLRGGFQMLTAAGDDGKVKSGTKILKHAAIGLVVIGLSWLLVTFIFYLINLNAEG